MTAQALPAVSAAASASSTAAPALHVIVAPSSKKLPHAVESLQILARGPAELVAPILKEGEKAAALPVSLEKTLRKLDKAIDPMRQRMAVVIGKAPLVQLRLLPRKDQEKTCQISLILADLAPGLMMNEMIAAGKAISALAGNAPVCVRIEGKPLTANGMDLYLTSRVNTDKLAKAVQQAQVSERARDPEARYKADWRNRYRRQRDQNKAVLLKL